MVGEKVEWWVNTSATQYIFENRDKFTSYELVGDDMNMFIGNSSSPSKVIGKGTMELHFTSRKTVTLREVLHVPYIKKNLVYGSFLSKHKFKIVIEFDKFVLTKHGVFIGKGFFTSEMCKLNFINEMPCT